jgi:hypothetical protein
MECNSILESRVCCRILTPFAFEGETSEELNFMLTLNDIWMRILDSLVSGGAYLIFTVILICASRAKGTGFRPALIYGAGFCGISVLNSMCTAYDLYNSGHLLIQYVRPVASFSKLIFAVYCWSKFSDLVVTLRRSDFGDKLLLDAENDRLQRRMNLVYVVSLAKERALAALDWAKSRSDTNVDPSASVDINHR